MHVYTYRGRYTLTLESWSEGRIRNFANQSWRYAGGSRYEQPAKVSPFGMSEKKTTSLPPVFITTPLKQN